MQVFMLVNLFVVSIPMPTELLILANLGIFTLHKWAWLCLKSDGANVPLIHRLKDFSEFDIHCYGTSR